MNETQLGAADALSAFYEGNRDLASLAPHFASLSLDDGLAVQRELFARRQAAGAQLVGYKVGLTSERARKAVGSDERPYGHITMLLDSGAELEATAPPASASQLALGGKLSVEPEMCFVIADELAGANVSAVDVRGAVSEVRAGYEINEARVKAGDSLALLVADNLTNYAIVEGEAAHGVPEPDALDDTIVTVTANGEERFSGRSADHVDNPYVSIAALVATLDRHELSLKPGQRVITGAYARFAAVTGETWTTTYEGIGAVEVSFR